MRLLIDTHVFVWLSVQPDLLSKRAAEAISDPDNDVLVSAVTAYEIELKRSRDPVLRRVPADLDLAVSAQQLQWLSVTYAHAAAAGQLPRLHGDPFDRLIIAQALAEGASVVSVDRWFPAYGVPVLW
jgi:PIN domain nuclease of toxin-antitoxin system